MSNAWEHPDTGRLSMIRLACISPPRGVTLIDRLDTVDWRVGPSRASVSLSRHDDHHRRLYIHWEPLEAPQVVRSRRRVIPAGWVPLMYV